MEIIKVITVKDLQEWLGVSYPLAAKKMREIKSVSDTFGLAGKCTEEDYRRYSETKGKGVKK